MSLALAPVAAPMLELRCPQCHNLVLRYRPADIPDAVVTIEARCRRCHVMFDAHLRPAAPLTRLRPLLTG